MQTGPVWQAPANVQNLDQFQQELKKSGRRLVILEGAVPKPTMEEIGTVRRKNYANQLFVFTASQINETGDFGELPAAKQFWLITSLRINGVEDKLTYQNELYQFQQELKKSGRRLVILEGAAPANVQNRDPVSGNSDPPGIGAIPHHSLHETEWKSVSAHNY